MRGSYCLVIVTILITALQATTSVKVVVIRENSSSRSIEESDEKSSSEESEEIDFLLDLIRKKESSERKSQPVTKTKTIKVIRKQQNKQKPSSKEIASESAIQKSTVPKETLKKPKEHKEYHVHYHSHQHQLPEEPSLKLDEDKIRPVYWDLGSHYEDYQPYVKQFKDYQPHVKQSKKMSMLLPFSESENLSAFKDYSSLLDLKLMHSPSSGEYVIGDAGDDHTKDFASTFESETFAKKLESDRNRKLMKKYQALLKSAATARPKINYSQKDFSSFEMSQPAKVPTRKPLKYINLNKPRLQKETFPNRDRFAGFTDFSSIESPQQKDKNPATQQSSKAEEGSSSKDFDFFVKDKPRQADFFVKDKPRQADFFVNDTPRKSMARPPKPKNFRKNFQQVKHRHGVMITPAKALQSQNMQLYKNRSPRVPRLLNAPGGIPMHVEKLNQMKANSGNLQYLNSLESGPRLLHVQPLNRPTGAFTSRLFDGWYLQRVQR